MNQAQIAFLRARELESYFREKVDLQYKGANGAFSEFEVSRVNNRPVNYPITVGFCQFPHDAMLYLHTDLTEDKEGTANIEFDLSGETLHGLQTGTKKIAMMEGLQSAISDRLFANVEDVAGQSFWRYLNREAEKTVEHPVHQVRDLFKSFLNILPGGPFGKQPGNTVVKADPSHILSVASTLDKVNPGLRDTAEDYTEPGSTLYDSPILVRPPMENGHPYLNPNWDYELSFSRSCSGGMYHNTCIFTPVDHGDPRLDCRHFEYDGMQITNDSIIFALDAGKCMEFSFSERSREQQRESPDTAHDNQQEERTEEKHPDAWSSPKHSKTQSLDSRIASAQARVKPPIAKQPMQHNHGITTLPER